MKRQANRSARAGSEHRRQIHLVARHGKLIETLSQPTGANLRTMQFRSPEQRAWAEARSARVSRASMLRMSAAAAASPLLWFAHALYVRMQLH